MFLIETFYCFFYQFSSLNATDIGKNIDIIEL